MSSRTVRHTKEGAKQCNTAHCIGCGHCNSRCPLHVKQQQRMQEIKAYFGKLSMSKIY
nr:MAG TPA: putative oxidoreductase [Caudoviricetes sp.]